MRPIDYFDRGAALAPDRIFVSSGGREVSYRDAQAQTHAIARGMYAAGFQTGDSVAAALDAAATFAAAPDATAPDAAAPDAGPSDAEPTDAETTVPTGRYEADAPLVVLVPDGSWGTARALVTEVRRRAARHTPRSRTDTRCSASFAAPLLPVSRLLAGFGY